MNATVITYAIYLTIALPLTVWVARNLFRNGRIFLVDCFHGSESLPAARCANTLCKI